MTSPYDTSVLHDISLVFTWSLTIGDAESLLPLLSFDVAGRDDINNSIHR
jgi:hypothetical protein